MAIRPMISPERWTVDPERVQAVMRRLLKNWWQQHKRNPPAEPAQLPEVIVTCPPREPGEEPRTLKADGFVFMGFDLLAGFIYDKGSDTTGVIFFIELRATWVILRTSFRFDDDEAAVMTAPRATHFHAQAQI